jgi:hypothetical protein
VLTDPSTTVLEVREYSASPHRKRLVAAGTVREALHQPDTQPPSPRCHRAWAMRCSPQLRAKLHGFRQPGRFFWTATTRFRHYDSVHQTANTSEVTYSATPPTNYVYNGDTMIGLLNVQALLPAGLAIPIEFTITCAGWANVLGLLGGGILAGGI